MEQRPQVAPQDRIEDFSAGGGAGACAAGSQPLELVSSGWSGWSGDYEGNGDHGKHKGWYKPWYKWLDEREDHLINRGD